MIGLDYQMYDLQIFLDLVVSNGNVVKNILVQNDL
jgi:hypothetical protein